jgi:hypothetical protein
LAIIGATSYRPNHYEQLLLSQQAIEVNSRKLSELIAPPCGDNGLRAVHISIACLKLGFQFHLELRKIDKVGLLRPSAPPMIGQSRYSPALPSPLKRRTSPKFENNARDYLLSFRRRSLQPDSKSSRARQQHQMRCSSRIACMLSKLANSIALNPRSEDCVNAEKRKC